MNRQAAWLITALFAGLTGCSSGTPPVEQAAAESDAAAGARIYRGSCIACHQVNGAGLQGVYPSLAGSPVVLGDPALLARWVIQGQRPPQMPAGRFPTVMPKFGWMTPREGAALLTHLRSGFGNSAPPVTPAAVAQALGE